MFYSWKGGQNWLVVSDIAKLRFFGFDFLGSASGIDSRLGHFDNQNRDNVDARHSALVGWRPTLSLSE